MPRSRRNSVARDSRNYGSLSGVTITTNPSGVTMYKGKIDYTSGYSLPYATESGLIMTSGILAIGAGATLARQTLGLSAIHNVTYGPSLKGAISAVTGVAIVCVPEGTKSFGSSCTQVTFAAYKLNRAGVTFTAGVSVHYIALGEA